MPKKPVGIQRRATTVLEMMPCDVEWLRKYVSDQCEDAFAHLVRKHLGLVYGVATRVLRDRSLAEEVTQAAFLELARQAASLGDRTVLSAWLHEVTRRKAIDVYRRERRRRERESLAMDQASGRTESSWDDLAPVVDEGLGALGHRDRTVLVMRYLEGDSLREIANVLGISEDAAQKRVARALDRLRRFLARRGVAIGSTGLGAALTANGVTVAPEALVQMITVQMANVLPASASLGGWLSTLSMPASSKLLVTAAAVVVVGWNVYQAQRIARLTTHALEVDASRTAALVEFERARDLIAAQNGEILGLRSRSNEFASDKLELMRLRNQVGELRAALRISEATQARFSNESDASEEALKSWMNRVKIMKALSGTMPDRAIPELRLLTEEDWFELAKEPLGLAPEGFDFSDPRNARMALSAARAKAKNRLAWVFHRALQGYAEANGGRVPQEVRELQPYLMNTNVIGPASSVHISADEVRDDILERYQMVAEGRLADQKEGEPVIAEVTPVDPVFDTLLRVGNNWLSVSPVEGP